MDRSEIIRQDEETLYRIETLHEPFESVDRLLNLTELNKRGCGICTYMRKVSRFKLCKEDRGSLEKNARVMVCPFVRCPFHKMDNNARYGDFDREREKAYRKMMAKLTAKKVEKALEEKKEEPPEPPVVEVTDRMRWLIKVRVSQGARIDHIMSEFNIPDRKQAEWEVSVAHGERTGDYHRVDAGSGDQSGTCGVHREKKRRVKRDKLGSVDN